MITRILISRRIICVHSVICWNLLTFGFFVNKAILLYECRKVTDISRRKSILCKNGHCFLCLEKGHLLKNCSVNYHCNKCKGKHNIMVCKGPGKPNPNTKKDSNPALAISDNETLITLNESRHSTLLQIAYSKVFNNKLSLNSSAHIMFDSGRQKSYLLLI